MPARLVALKRYQRTRRSRPFDDLPPDQRARAETHYQRLCDRWGDDLPPWRRAILAGRAKDLVIRPRDATWAHGMRRRHTQQPTLPAATQPPPRQISPQPAAVGSQFIADSARAVSAPPAVRPIMAFSIAPPNAASQPRVTAVTSSAPASPTAPPRSGAVQLDLHGITASGTDGHDTAQRILRDLDRAFGGAVRFSMAIPGKDLPPRWAWHLELVPVP